MKATCGRCGKTFRTYPSRIRDGKGQYCSKACQWSRDVRDRFFSFVNTVDGHWIWSGHRNAGDYGTLKVGRNSLLAHRVAWFLATGKMPPSDADIGHTCDIPSCVCCDETGTYTIDGVEYERHGHLWLGTAQDNMDDMRAKGRAPDYRAIGLKAGETKRKKRQVSLLPPV